ncbi:MAG: hypothetical protein ACU83V_11465 [Gammaproteobacteria bacterium]
MNEHKTHPAPGHKPIPGDRSEPLPWQITKAAEDIWQGILDWYNNSGAPLI